MEGDKIQKYCKVSANGMLFIIYITTIILIVIWLFKLLHNTKSEPTNRIRYISKDPSNYYSEGDFCYEYFEDFIRKGAIDTFDFPIKNIKKYTRALLATIFISIGSLVFSLIFVHISKHSYSLKECIGCAGVFYVFLILGVILSLIFSIILIHYYFKGNYSDFEEFSRCSYLTKNFRRDYNFIFKMQDSYKTPFVLILFTEFFNFIKLISEFDPKDID